MSTSKTTDTNQRAGADGGATPAGEAKAGSAPQVPPPVEPPVEHSLAASVVRALAESADQRDAAAFIGYLRTAEVVLRNLGDAGQRIDERHAEVLRDAWAGAVDGVVEQSPGEAEMAELRDAVAASWHRLDALVTTATPPKHEGGTS